MVCQVELILLLVFPAVLAQVLPLFQVSLFGLALVQVLLQAFLVELVQGWTSVLVVPAELDQGPPLHQVIPAMVRELLLLQVFPSGLDQGQPFLLLFLAELDLVLT
jgi:hypothetical protein